MNNYKDNLTHLYDHIKPSEALKSRTTQLMKEELRKKNHSTKTPYFRTYRSALALTCAFILLIGFNFYNRMLTPSLPDTGPNGPNMKVAINLKGTVTDIDKEHFKYAIDHKWIIINKDTVFTSLDGSPLSKNIEVGHYIEGNTVTKNQPPHHEIATHIYVNEKK